MLNGKKVVALLPIKANSERVKGKNFRMFSGKPLFKWILDTLLSIKDIWVVPMAYGPVGLGSSHAGNNIGNDIENRNKKDFFIP